MILAMVWLPFVLLSASGAFAIFALGVPVPPQLEAVPPERLPRLFLLVGALGPALVVLCLVKLGVDSLDRLFTETIAGPPRTPSLFLTQDDVRALVRSGVRECPYCADGASPLQMLPTDPDAFCDLLEGLTAEQSEAIAPTLSRHVDSLPDEQRELLMSTLARRARGSAP